MKKALFAILGIGLLASASCSKAPSCTPEMLSQKTQEINTALQAAITKDPSKQADLAKRVQDVIGKYPTTTAASAEACKALDDLIATLKM